jgi:hypothetical protein
MWGRRFFYGQPSEGYPEGDYMAGDDAGRRPLKQSFVDTTTGFYGPGPRTNPTTLRIFYNTLVKRFMKRNYEILTYRKTL